MKVAKMSHHGPQSGMTILESLIALSIFAVVIWAAMANYTTILGSLGATRLYADIHSLRWSVIDLHRSQPSYGNLDMQTIIIDARRVPTTLSVTDGGFRALDGSLVEVGGAGDSFFIRLSQASRPVCIQLLGRISGDQWESVQLIDEASGVISPAMPSSALPASQADLPAICTGSSMSINLRTR